MRGYKATDPDKVFGRIACPECLYIGQRREFYGNNAPSAMIGTCPKCKQEVTI